MATPGNRRPYDDLARAIVGATDRTSRQVPLTGSTTDGGIDDERQASAWSNPMTAAGSLIEGGESGSAIELLIGLEDYVLTVVSVSGVLHPRWAAPTGGSGTGRYREYTLVSDGSGGFEFIDDGDGEPVYTLEDLE